MKKHPLFFTAILACFTLQLSGCGFTPVYGEGVQTGAQGQEQSQSIANQFNATEIAIIPNREGQFLRNALIDRFYSHGAPTKADYNLKISPINERIYDFDITPESEATRQQLCLKTTMKLINKETKQTLFTRDLNAISSNNVLESEFSTLVTEQNSRENALNDLARQIERQLALYFAE